MKKYLSLIMCLILFLNSSLVCFSLEEIQITGDESDTIEEINIIPFEVISDEDSGIIQYAPIERPAVKSARRSALVRSAPSSLPSSFTSENITPVRSQGPTGSCWTFSTMASLEAYAVSHNLAEKSGCDFSEAQLAWYTWTPTTDTGNDNYGEGIEASDYVTGGNPYDVGGNWQTAAITLAQGIGISNESTLPLLNGYEPVEYDESNRYTRDTGLVIRDAFCFTDRNDVKSWIYENGCVSASMYFDMNYCTWPSLQNNYRSCYYSGTSNTSNHGISIVGWDDNYPKSNFSIRPPSDGAWLVKNSYGTAYHSNGFFWLSYSEASLGDFVGFTCMPDNYKKIYTHNAFTPNSYFDMSSGVVIANKFRAEGNEKLSAVSFLTYNDNLTVTIDIYRNTTFESTPKKGTRLCTQTVSVPHSGYITVPLSSPATLSAGNAFSVVLTLKSVSGETISIPAELKNSGIEYVSHRYESYIASSSGSSLLDLFTAVSNSGNLFINALTECVHNYSSQGVTGSCTEGRTETFVCSNCGKEYTEVFEPVDHSFDETVIAEPTCKDSGMCHKICRDCGFVCDEEIPALPHTLVTEAGVPATCTEQGRTERIYCSECGTEISPSEIIPMKKHNIELHTTEYADCTHEGNGYYYCKDCGQITEDNVVLHTSHSYTKWSQWETDKLDSNKLSRERQCTKCGFVQRQERNVFEEDSNLKKENVLVFLITKVFRRLINAIFSMPVRTA